MAGPLRPQGGMYETLWFSVITTCLGGSRAVTTSLTCAAGGFGRDMQPRAAVRALYLYSFLTWLQEVDGTLRVINRSHVRVHRVIGREERSDAAIAVAACRLESGRIRLCLVVVAG